jgi:hypothetical protein
MLRRIFVALFPLALFGIELVLRKSAKWDTEGFIGPSLASIGLGFILSVQTPKEPDFRITERYQDQLERDGYALIKRWDKIVMDAGLLILCIALPAWIFSLYAASEHLLWSTYSAGLLAGLLNTVLGTILYIAKELA